MVVHIELLTLLYSSDMQKDYILYAFASPYPIMIDRFVKMCFLSPLPFKGLLCSFLYVCRFKL